MTRRQNRILLILALLALAAFLAADLKSEHDAIAVQARQQLAREAETLGAEFNRKLQAISETIESARPLLQPAFPQKERNTARLLAIAAAAPDIRTLVVLDADGDVLASNRAGLTGLNHRDNARFQALRQLNDPDALYISQPFIAPPGVSTLSLGKAILDAHGLFGGGILAVLDPEHFAAPLKTARDAAGTRAALLYADGSIVFGEHPDAEQLTVLRPTSLGGGQAEPPFVVSVSRETAAVFYHWRKDVVIRGFLFAALAIIAIGGLLAFQRRQAACTELMLAGKKDQAEAETARKQAEAEAPFHALFEQAPAGLALIDSQNGQIRELNERFAEIVGQSRKELMDSPWLTLPLPSAKEFRMEYPGTRPNGSTAWIGVTVAPITSQPSRLIAVAEDITETQTTLQALQARAARLELALSGAGAAVWEWDLPSGEWYFDPRWAEMLGYEPGELALDESGWEMRICTDDLPRVKERLERHLRGETPFYDTEYRARHKSGRWIRVKTLGSVVKQDEEGYPVRVAGIVFDLTQFTQAADPDQ